MSMVSINQFAKNVSWKFADFIVRKVVSLGISIILARIIAPEEFGIIALTTVFITFSDIFIFNGFNIALIRKEKVNDIDFSTIMIISVLFVSLLYAIFFSFAPLIATFYNCSHFCSVLRLITILLFPQAISSVIRAKATRELNFKILAIASLLSNVIAGITALVMAIRGLGIWSLVAQQVLANFIELVILIILTKWRFSLRFSFIVARETFKFTIGVIGASFLDFLGNNVCSLIIGKAYSTKELGYYDRARVLPETIALNTYNSIASVLLPTLSSVQDDDEAFKRIARKSTSLTMYLILPMMLGLSAVANNLIPVLLTSKWKSCIPFLFCFCACYAINPIRAIGNTIFYAKGYSQIVLRIEIVRAFLLILSAIIVSFVVEGSILSLMIINVAISLFVAIATHYYTNKVIHYSFAELFDDIKASIFLSFIMAIIVVLIGKIQIDIIVVLLLQIFSGVAVYYLGSKWLRIDNYALLKNYLFSRKKRTIV